MHSLVLLTHSLVRFFLLITLILVIVRSLMGWLNKSDYTKLDEKLNLGLFMLTHTQMLLGIILYLISPRVIFSSESMKDPMDRYWLVEHITGMIIAIVLISVARISSKKLAAVARHKRIFILNAIAFVVIIAMIAQSQRGFLELRTN